MTINEAINDIIEGGAGAFKFEAIGDTCKGRVVRADVRQQTDPDGNPRIFKSGEPMNQVVITVEQDNGDEAALYFKGGNYEVADGKGKSSLNALRDALNGQQVQVGAILAMQYSGNGKKTNPAFSAPKLYTVQYQAPSLNVDPSDSLI